MKKGFRKPHPVSWLVVVYYAGDPEHMDVIGCTSYAQARTIVGVAELHIPQGGVHTVLLLDAHRRVVYESERSFDFPVYAHIPAPGKYRWDLEKELLVARAN